ncbi:hypothetical protein HDU88_000198 [Geranomyces variabilis]|nr:hypothetical protein HDU88_000198 [Geranomyces variabilis]
MGIPKFFRWISERYPLCSQLIQENRIPEFDNLYLDMNGIIHNCSHPNDGDVHFRMTEDQIFLAIFNYIDHLFARIKPQKLFFLAVDGVAPRAKMNQQRARRFRTAKDNADAIAAAIKKGEKLPKEPGFDSNCITPGTPFMVRLQEQLKYFINKKITEDAAWHGVEVILSGHEVPGEGEHKIMEYIRLAKSQPTWDPNMRHCLYGLDADLMMLGLLSHEPHFALLREEVTFGRSRKKGGGTTNLDSQNFYLMHLSLFREYIDAEFSMIRAQLKSEYDLEKIIDDFILMAYFVGNDFLPNLPGLHINEGAMALMFKIYKKMLLDGGGYLNEGGKLRLDRCEVFLRGLGEYEKELFQVEVGDVKWIKGKRGEAPVPAKKSSRVISKVQRALYERIKTFVLAPRENAPRLMFSTNMPARDRKFIINLANDLGITHTIDAIGEGKALPQHHIILDWDEDDDEEDEESMEARQRVLRRWDAAEVIDEEEIANNLEAEEKQKMDEAFIEWKREYYKEKLNIDYDDDKQMSKFIYHYVEGLQWVAEYYYNGVASWEWFYPYHYGPKITDLVNLARFDIKFDIGRPFLPFEQLMGVLPAASNEHIPPGYRSLMTDLTSPIIDFYPVVFELDANGKKADWEAVVKIPFIDEKRLLQALKSRENQLTKEEKSRNTHGQSFIFKLNADAPHTFASTLPGAFPDLVNCICDMKGYELPRLGPSGFRKGLCVGAKLGIELLPGFPSMKTLAHTATLGFHGVTVFNMESPNESMIVSCENKFEGRTPEQLAKMLVGTRVHIGWPFLQEAHVTSLMDDSFKYEVKGQGGRTDVVKTVQTPAAQDHFYKTIERLESYYSKRYGTITGPVEIVANVLPLKGMRLQEDGSLVKEFASRREETSFPVQMIITSVVAEDPRFKELPPPAVTTEYPVGSQVFFLGAQGYGLTAEVIGHGDDKLQIKLAKPVEPEILAGLHFTREMAIDAEAGERYMPSWQVAKSVRMSTLALSKVTSSLHVVSKTSDQRYNLGLNLKFESKKKKVLGYSRKTHTGWEFSHKAVDLISEYKSQFPAFFAGLEKKAKSDFYEDTDFYHREAAERVAEIKDWLKNCGAKDFERVSLETKALTKAVVKGIEGRVEEFYAKLGPLHVKGVTVKNVPRQAILKPAHSKHRLSHQTFDLGDRVQYVVDTGSVPLGSRGFVAALEGDFIDVVFDRGFLGGSNLSDRCGELKGLAVHKHTLMNLTHTQPPIEGTQPTQLVPIDRPIPKFQMRSGGGNAAMQQRQAEAWVQKPITETARNAWAPDAVGGRDIRIEKNDARGPAIAGRNPKANGVAGPATAPVKMEEKRGPASVPKAAQPPGAHAAREPRTNDSEKQKQKAPAPAPAAHPPQPAQTAKSASAPPAALAKKTLAEIEAAVARERNVSAEETLTQNLKNMLHIRGSGTDAHAAAPSGPPAQTYNPPPPVAQYPQQPPYHSVNYGPPGPPYGFPPGAYYPGPQGPLPYGQPHYPYQGGGYPPPHQGYHPQQEFAPQQQYTPAGPPGHAEDAQTEQEQANLHVSQQILAMLQPQTSQAHPYHVAAGVAAQHQPSRRPPNELAQLVQSRGGGRGGARGGGAHNRGGWQGGQNERVAPARDDVPAPQPGADAAATPQGESETAAAADDTGDMNTHPGSRGEAPFHRGVGRIGRAGARGGRVAWTPHNPHAGPAGGGPIPQQPAAHPAASRGRGGRGGYAGPPDAQQGPPRDPQQQQQLQPEPQQQQPQHIPLYDGPAPRGRGGYRGYRGGGYRGGPRGGGRGRGGY